MDPFSILVIGILMGLHFLLAFRLYQLSERVREHAGWLTHHDSEIGDLKYPLVVKQEQLPSWLRKDPPVSSDAESSDNPSL